MHFISCSNDNGFARRLATSLNQKYSKLQVQQFPDNELYVRFPKSIKNDVVILVQTFYGNINLQLVEVLMAAHAAKSYKADKIILLSNYFLLLSSAPSFFLFLILF